MNRAEALEILAHALSPWRARPYDELLALVDHPSRRQVTGPSGADYQIEIVAVFDDRAGANLRVIGSIDDGGLRAWVPLTDDFIVAADPPGAR